MVLSKRISAHVTTVFEIDMTRVDQLRQKYGPVYQERSGVKLTYMPFILKAAIDALKAFPVLNASVEGDAIVYRHDINIGIAVALDWGLNRARDPQRRREERPRPRPRRERPRRACPDQAPQGRGSPGRHVHHHKSWRLREPVRHPDHQPAPGRDPGTGVIEKRTVVRDDAIAIRTMATSR